MDEIDEALKALAIENLNKTSSSRSSQDQKSLQTEKLFLIEPKFLDADQELRKMFGSKVISSSTSSTPARWVEYFGPRISNNPHHHLNLKSKSAILAKPIPTWFPHNKASAGLSMHLMTKSQLGAAGLAWSQQPWFFFEHSMSFRVVQSRFITAIMSFDPSQFLNILRTFPYHPDTLLQLSETSRDQGDPGQSLDFLNRALYSFEKAFHPTFNIAKTECRLDFSRIENRGFFRALELKMQSLMKRGCWRTSFETCKLLLSLNPHRDPYGSLLWMDLLAVKARQYQYLLDLLELMPKVQNQDPNGGLYIEAYPGLYYSKALCLKEMLDEGGSSNRPDCSSTIALETAILRFPQVVIPLAAKIGFELPPAFFKVKRAELRTSFSPTPDNVLHLQSQIYVSRCVDLWKDPDTRSWLQNTIERCHLRLEDQFDPDVLLGQEFAESCNSDIYLEGIYRSVFVSDAQPLKRFIPPTVTQGVTYSFDPLPPKDGNSYDADYFANVSASETPVSRHHQPVARPALNDDRGDPAGQDRLAENVNRAGLFDLLLGANWRGPDQVIEQLRLALMAEDNEFDPAERHALLERLHDLMEGADRFDPFNEDADETLNPGEEPHDEQTADADDSEPSSEPETQNRMPGSFWG